MTHRYQIIKSLFPEEKSTSALCELNEGWVLPWIRVSEGQRERQPLGSVCVLWLDPLVTGHYQPRAPFGNCHMTYFFSWPSDKILPVNIFTSASGIWGSLYFFGLSNLHFINDPGSNLQMVLGCLGLTDDLSKVQARAPFQGQLAIQRGFLQPGAFRCASEMLWLGHR